MAAHRGKGVVSWMLFDWANQPFQTLIVTFGCGLIQLEGGPIEEIRSGDVVLRQPGDPVPPPRDARRGRNGLDLSARGVGRSHWSDDADGSSDLD